MALASSPSAFTAATRVGMSRDRRGLAETLTWVAAGGHEEVVG